MLGNANTVCCAICSFVYLCVKSVFILGLGSLNVVVLSKDLEPEHTRRARKSLPGDPADIKLNCKPLVCSGAKMGL